MEEENMSEVVSELLKSKSKENCCVYECKSIRKDNRNLSFHKFPKPKQIIKVQTEFGDNIDQDRRKLWETRLKMGKKITENMAVCSLHFKKEDFHSTGCYNRRVLLPTAVPSQNLPLSKSIAKKTEERSVRLENRSARLEKQRNLIPPEEIPVTFEERNLNSAIHENQMAAAQSLLFFSESNIISKKYVDVGTQTESSFFTTITTECQTEFSHLDAETQVNSEPFFQFSDCVSTDKELNSLTGLHSFALLNMLVSMLMQVKCDNRIHRLTDKSRVFLTFMKLKLDLPYVVLGTFFKISSQTCKKIFIETVQLLSEPLQDAILFPAYEHIQRNIPKCFKDFPNVRIILDCTEIMIQKPNRLCCQIKLYSNYKGSQTVKFMTGVAPSGLITFVSSGFGGRTSDKNIFESSNLLSKLRMDRDVVMVDKGFHIKEICNAFGIKVIQPPFLRRKTQFSSSEALLNAKIASARVHIERSNQRIKIFKILSNRLPANLLPYIDDIFLIACAITNLSNPILSDDKFL